MPDKQKADLIACIAENLPEMDSNIKQGWIDNPSALKQFLQGLCPPEAIVSEEEAPLDTIIIHVDRFARRVFPDFVEVVMHPELQAVGPTEYDLAKEVELYLHEGQNKDVGINGIELYKHLYETNSLKICLGLHDALEIKKKGVMVFRQVFGNKSVPCWKSVVRGFDGCLHVPYFEDGGRRGVVVDWRALATSYLDDGHPAVRFRKLTISDSEFGG